jgi:hypothetical protein
MYGAGRNLLRQDHTAQTAIFATRQFDGHPTILNPVPLSLLVDLKIVLRAVAMAPMVCAQFQPSLDKTILPKLIFSLLANLMATQRF